MPRAEARFITEAQKNAIEPLYLVQLLHIKSAIGAPDDALYLTDSQEPVVWFDEDSLPAEYLPCGLQFSQNEVRNDNTITTARLSLNNVSRQFSALAQHYKLNGTMVNVYRGFRNLLAYPDGAQLLMSGRLKKVIINEKAIEAEIWTDFSLSIRVPRRVYSTNDFPYIPVAKDVRDIFTG